MEGQMTARYRVGAFKPQKNNKSWSGVSFLLHTQVSTIDRETVNVILDYQIKASF